jgi:hypothetical protein
LSFPDFGTLGHIKLFNTTFDLKSKLDFGLSFQGTNGVNRVLKSTHAGFHRIYWDFVGLL